MRMNCVLVAAAVARDAKLVWSAVASADVHVVVNAKYSKRQTGSRTSRRVLQHLECFVELCCAALKLKTHNLKRIVFFSCVHSQHSV